jgi:glycosyltransferase involved in cell wall biosynthesis
MWTKNGSRTLPLVLKKIEEVIPQHLVQNKILVDDHSVDNTREIAESFGWWVIPNEGKGISDGANTALKHVKSEFFISFEQDLLLAKEWWEKVPKLLKKKRVAIASGIRLPDKPLSIRKLQEHVFRNYRQQYQKDERFIKGKTLDNTIYRTEILRKIGGFPKLDISAGVDTVLAYRIYDYRYRWLVDFDVVSIHLREELWNEVKHYYWYGKCYNGLRKALGEKRIAPIWRIFLTTIYSPVKGSIIAFKERCIYLVLVYPLIRIAILFGVIRSVIT